MLDFSLVTTASTSLLQSTELEDLLIYLKQAKQIDLTGYKRPSLQRRIGLRMRQVGAECYQDYFDHLQQHSNEVADLLSTVFINFTYFFRDRPVWDYLNNLIIPQIIARKSVDAPIRVWSAGCASGQEAYSVAMLLAEALGLEQFQQRVQIYGADIDHDAILQAQRGVYPAYAIDAIPPHLLERYFEPTADGCYQWRQDLRASVTFHHHDLIQSAPLPQIDLLVCRNMLMYLTLETQTQVLTHFNGCLSESGFLLLGQAESLTTRPQTSLFAAVDWQAKLFTKAQSLSRHRKASPIAF